VASKEKSAQFLRPLRLLKKLIKQKAAGKKTTELVTQKNDGELILPKNPRSF
jgi:hypothetical protein